MAIRGSTRMQASSILQLAFGLALLLPEKSIFPEATNVLKLLKEHLEGLDLGLLERLVLFESGVYQAQGRVTYEADPYYLITVFTDTT
jgi:hypothetical protein